MERLDNWPNVERDEQRHVVGFSGLTLRTTAHSFRVDHRGLHTWCVWDTLFLPVVLDETASVQSECAVTGAEVELVVSPRGVESARPHELYVTFPPLTGIDTRAITSSFCCHVVFIADVEAAREWEATHPGGRALDVGAAYELGRQMVTPLLGIVLQRSRR
jgi:alkylmercury lyase